MITFLRFIYFLNLYKSCLVTNYYINLLITRINIINSLVIYLYPSYTRNKKILNSIHMDVVFENLIVVVYPPFDVVVINSLLVYIIKK